MLAEFMLILFSQHEYPYDLVLLLHMILLTSHQVIILQTFISTFFQTI